MEMNELKRKTRSKRLKDGNEMVMMSRGNERKKKESKTHECSMSTTMMMTVEANDLA